MNDVDDSVVDDLEVQVLVAVLEADEYRFTEVVIVRGADLLELRRINYPTTDKHRVCQRDERTALEACRRADSLLPGACARGQYARQFDTRRAPHDGRDDIDRVTRDGGDTAARIDVVKSCGVRYDGARRSCRHGTARGQQRKQRCRHAHEGREARSGSPALQYRAQFLKHRDVSSGAAYVFGTVTWN